MNTNLKAYLSGLFLMAVIGTGCQSVSGNKTADDNTVGAVTTDDSEIQVVKKWELPSNLKEISGISYLDKDRLACIQDELGHIFIFNMASGKVEKDIPFGDPGDYEGLAIEGDNCWVLRSDGTLFRVNNFQSGKPGTDRFSTFLTAKQDCEGLFYDASNNRLLVAIKEKDPTSTDYKGVYGFSIATKTMSKTPVFELTTNTGNSNGKNNNGKKKKSSTDIKPSAIAIHPVSKEVYITDGPNGRLYIASPAGTINRTINLDHHSFPQPEGIIFSPSGDLFISNEGPKGPGTILQVHVAR